MVQFEGYQIGEYDHKFTYKRNYSDRNTQTFYHLIRNEKWDGLYESTSTFHDKFSLFCDTFLYHYNCSFPMKKTKAKIKLEGIGIRGKPHNWVVSYLADRCQTTAIDGASSECKSNALGIPQGTLLGPIFFIIFINDISKHCLRNVSVP